MTAYAGKAALTVVRCEGGTAVQVYAGNPVPSSALPDDVKRLEAEGFIEQVDDDTLGGMPSDVPGQPKFGVGTGNVAVNYDDLKVPDLKAEIDRRNEGREDDAKVKPDSDKKADLIAALEVDDAAVE